MTETFGDFELRIWDPDDIATVDLLLDAATAVDGRENFGRDWFLWKFRDSPHGPAVVSFAVDTASGRIAGVVAFGMWTLFVDRAPVSAALSYETFVLPDFQRRGLFSALYHRAEAELVRRRARICFNFPNSQSLPGFLKLGWTDLGGIETWARALRPLRVGAALVRRRGRLAAAVPDRGGAAALDAGKWCSDDAARTAGWSTRIIGSRSLELLRWRYTQQPVYRYHQVNAGDDACAIVRSAERVGLREAQLMEVVARGTPTRRHIGDITRAIRRSDLADIITVIVTRGHPLRRLLPTHGYLPIPNHAHFCGRDLSNRVGQLGSQRDWALTATEIHTM